MIIMKYKNKSIIGVANTDNSVDKNKYFRVRLVPIWIMLI